MAVFRVEKNKGYTVMSNHHLRNKNLTLKAKGLLSQMLSLPEDWDYTLKGLSHINRESIDAIRTAVWELEKAGYIRREQSRDPKGKMADMIYTIYEQPVLDCPVLENPTSDNPVLENPTSDNPASENPTQLNKEVQRTDLPKKEKIITDGQSTHGSTSLEDIYRTFNIDHPADFRGHSLSVSDIVVLNRDGKEEAHYCDSIGFTSVPEFFLQREKQLTPDELLTGESIQTPRGSFLVTDMSREQLEAAGYGFHHQSEDGKYLIMGNGTDAFAIPAQQENPLRTAELSTEQNENMIDGIINNTPPEPQPEEPEQLSFKDVATTSSQTQEETPEAAPTQTPVRYYPINEGAARRAKEAMSFSDYRPGSATAEYRHYVDQAVEIAQRQKKRVEPEYHEKIDSLLDTYARKLAENMNKGYEIAARVPSVLIAGPANFPVRAKEKQNAASDRNMEEFQYIQGLLDKIRSTGMGGISADDPQAVSKLERKLEKLEASQELMKAVNTYYRNHKLDP